MKQIKIIVGNHTEWWPASPIQRIKRFGLRGLMSILYRKEIETAYIPPTKFVVFPALTYFDEKTQTWKETEIAKNLTDYLGYLTYREERHGILSLMWG